MKNLNHALMSAGLGLALVTGSAVANNVQLNESGIGNGEFTNSLQLPVASFAQNYFSGFQQIVVDGNSFLAYCVDPFQYSTGAVTTYTTADLSATFGSSRTININKLYNEAYAGTLAGPNANFNAASFQLALWEVANDDGNLSTGQVKKTASTNAAIVAGAQVLLNGLNAASSASNYSYSLYTSPRNQDFLVAMPVPEPETYAMMLAGLGLLGFIARRKSKKESKKV